MAKYDVTRTNAAIERALKVTENPRHRFLLQAYYRHRFLEIAGRYAAVALPLDDGLQGDLAVPEYGVYAMSAYLNDRAASIYAGTNEVQRNIIAAHLLGR